MRTGVWLDPRSGDEERLLAAARVADEVGISSVWIPERHFSATEPLPSSLVLAAAIAAETDAIRIAPVVPLALHHPLSIAEDAAVVDHLSAGRLMLAADPAGVNLELEGYGISRATWRRRFDEALEILPRAWSSDGFAWVGEAFRIPLRTRAVATSGFVPEPSREVFVLPWKRAGLPFDYVSVLPKPAQMPHPPLFVVGDGAETIALAARRGYSLLLGVGEAASSLEDDAKQYREELERAGRDVRETMLAVVVGVCVDEDGEKARRQAAGGRTIAGSPDDVFEAIRRLEERTGLTQIVCAMDGGSASSEELAARIRLFSAEVMSRLET